MSRVTLDKVRVASPCKELWSEMVGDDRARFCASCSRNVYNLSAMDREEAERFVNEHEGRACIRYYRRADGTMLTRDCPTGQEQIRADSLRVGARFGLLFGLMAGTAVLPRVVAHHDQPKPLLPVAAPAIAAPPVTKPAIVIPGSEPLTAAADDEGVQGVWYVQ